MQTDKARNSIIPADPDHRDRVRLILEEDDTEWWETWWFWTLLIVMVAGAATTWAVPGTLERNVQDTGNGKAVIQEN